MPKQAPYGYWESPISVESVLASATTPLYPQRVQGWNFWLEARPAQKGRQVIVAQMPDGSKRELLPAEFSARSQFLEYGGCPYWLADSQLFFINGQDQNLYSLDYSDPNAAPLQLTACANCRFADLAWDKQRKRLLAVMETQREDALSTLSIVSIDLTELAQRPQILHQGADFYAYLTLSHCGNFMAFIQWTQGHMPWDATALMVAQLGAMGTFEQLDTWISEEQDQAITQPQFGPDGYLYWVSDASNWWNLYRRQPGTSSAQPIAPMPAECATPRWVSGMSSYCFIGSAQLLFCYTQHGLWNLGLLDLTHLSWRPLLANYPQISQLSACAEGAVFLAASAQLLPKIQFFHAGQLEELDSTSVDPLAGYFSNPRSVYFQSGQHQVHAFYYPPHNPDYPCLNPTPPVIVLCHGGPTGQTSAVLNLKNQYWTSRGFAVLDVNYRGSTGFGRIFRNSLRSLWGIADVEDLCRAALWVSEQGLAGKRFIKGSSAGGFSVLAALAFHDTFDAGVSLYGIGDLALLAEDTHTFEARYLDLLVGPYPAQAERYRERSPLFAVSGIKCPVLIFQGLLDKVVPPNQAQTLVANLKNQGTQVTYVEFADEGHGFRQAQSISEQMQREQEFYQQLLSL